VFGQVKKFLPGSHQPCTIKWKKESCWFTPDCEVYTTTCMKNTLQTSDEGLFDWLTSLFKTRDPFHKLKYVLFNGDVYLYARAYASELISNK
jgi:hypothetical protein